MSDPAMTRFPVPDVEDLPEDIQERIVQEEADAGFIANVFLAMAYRPSQFRAFFQYYDALVEDTELDRAEIEMIIVAVSGANDCLYCNVAHGALARIYADDPQIAEQLISNHRTANVSEERRAMLDFAVKLTENQAEIGEDDFERLREHGYSRRAIWDIGSVAAFFNLSNRMAHLADMRPNDEFYGLGR
ncbi:peroxidase-related enzyme [Halosimplex carlsbadense]|nr:peroxidase-related enzyme [Halosimplex carlsbadense]